MFKGDLFEQWLDNEAQRVLTKLNENEPLSQDDKLIVVIKGLTNHIVHLDAEIKEELIRQRQDSDRRFEQVDKRIEQVDNKIEQMDKKIEQMDKRLEQVDKKLEQVDRRFEQVDKRFENVNNKFEKITDELKNIYGAINSQTWKVIGAVGLIVHLGKLIETFGK